MKTLQTLSLFVALALFVVSCGNSGSSKPEDIGKQAFSAIRKLSTESQEKYIETFITIDELRKIGDNHDGDQNRRTNNRLTSITKEEWTKELNKMYFEVKKKGASYGIVWADIQFLDYIYKIGDAEGLKIMAGELYFKYAETSYKMTVSAIWTGRQYRILLIEQLKRQ